jgi:hypothetical protein
MRHLFIALIAGGAAAAGAASAQPPGAPRAILFDQPNFQGSSITIVQGSANLAAQDYAGRAMSGHFDGEWLACDAPNFGGHCQHLSGDVTDFGGVGLGRRLASLRQSEAAVNGGPAPGRRLWGPISEGYDQTPVTEGESEYYDRGAALARPAEAASPPAAPPQPAKAAGPPGPTPPPHAGIAAASAPAPPRAMLAGGVSGHAAIFFAHPRRRGVDVAGVGRRAADSFCRTAGLGPALYYDSEAGKLRDVLCRRE